MSTELVRRPKAELAALAVLQREAEARLLYIRGRYVVLDSDLAEFFDIPTGELNRNAERNEARFPADFRFQLTADETSSLQWDNPIAKPRGRGGRRGQPWVYTKMGAMAAAGVVKSTKADAVAVAIPHAFEALEEIVMDALPALIGSVRALQLNTVTTAEFDRAIASIERTLSGLGRAVGEVQKRLPPELTP